VARVSIVVPTYNCLVQLQRAIVGLEKQTFSRDRFGVVVSDGPSDGTEEYLRTMKTPLRLRPV
jgi:glycosyltransferase involved in cell wall biosynthesis